MNNKIKEFPQFIRVALYDSPQSAPYFIGNAALISGNNMYGELIILEVLSEDSNLNNITTGDKITASEWEWDGGIPLTGKALERVSKLYQDI